MTSGAESNKDECAVLFTVMELVVLAFLVLMLIVSPPPRSATPSLAPASLLDVFLYAAAGIALLLGISGALCLRDAGFSVKAFAFAFLCFCLAIFFF